MVGYGVKDMEKTKKKSFSYSTEWNLMTYLQHELNNVTLNEQNEEIKKVVGDYLKVRVKEIKESLK